MGVDLVTQLFELVTVDAVFELPIVLFQAAGVAFGAAELQVQVNNVGDQKEHQRAENEYGRGDIHRCEDTPDFANAAAGHGAPEPNVLY